MSTVLRELGAEGWTESADRRIRRRGSTGQLLRLRNRGSAIRQAFVNFLDGASATLILIFDESGDREGLLLQELKHLPDGRISLTEWLIGPIIFLTIF